MILPPPKATPTTTLFPFTPLFRSLQCAVRLAILRRQLGYKVADRADARYRSCPLARPPDVLPRLYLGIAAGPEVHRLEVAFGQIVGVESGLDDRAAQIVAVHPGEQVRIDEIRGAAFDDAILLPLVGIGLGAGEAGTSDIGQFGMWSVRERGCASV